MKTELVNNVDFSEIFYFAEEHFSIGWNEANDLFFRSGTLNYKSYTDIYLGDAESEWSDPNMNKAYEVLKKFMVDNNVESMHVKCT